MAEKNLNRIKVMLAEKGKTNKWLAEKLGRDQATISKWCTNACQPPLEALIQIAQCLEVDIKELIRVPEHNHHNVRVSFSPSDNEGKDREYFNIVANFKC